MFGILLVTMSTFLDEFATSLGKKQVQKKKENIYAVGFLSLFFGFFFFVILALFRGTFVFSFASIPTFLLRLVLEIIQVQVSIIAMVRAERSTFEFIRLGTIPVLLGIDILLHYTVSIYQIFGMCLLLGVLMLLVLNRGLSMKGLGFVLFSTINAAFTISLYKYHINNFNSVEAEQGIVYLFLMLYFIIASSYTNHRSPFHFLKERIGFAQSFSQGVGGVLSSFAYSFAPASIILSAHRALAVLWAIISGNIFFKEKHVGIKIVSLLLIILALILLL